jgi:hypothetical protein
MPIPSLPVFRHRTDFAYFSCWFDCDGWSVQLPPPDCVADCSAQGRVDEAVDYWVHKLSFEAPAWLLRRYLKRYGVWDRRELCDYQRNLRRLLWIWCGNISDGSESLIYLADL